MTFAEPRKILTLKMMANNKDEAFNAHLLYHDNMKCLPVLQQIAGQEQICWPDR